MERSKASDTHSIICTCDKNSRRAKAKLTSQLHTIVNCTTGLSVGTYVRGWPLNTRDTCTHTHIIHQTHTPSSTTAKLLVQSECSLEY